MGDMGIPKVPLLIKTLMLNGVFSLKCLLILLDSAAGVTEKDVDIFNSYEHKQLEYTVSCLLTNMGRSKNNDTKA